MTNVPTVVKRIQILLTLAFIFFSASAQKFPESYFRAQAALENGEFAQAIIWIDSAIISSPSNENFWLKRGEINYISKDFNAALEDFQTAEKYKKQAASYWLAKTYAQLNDTAKAFEQLEIHLNSRSKESEATILLDEAFDKLHSTKQWKEIWLTDWYNSSEKMYAEIEYLFEQESWNEAIETLNQRIEGRSAGHQLFALRGEAYFNIGSYKAAEADFSHAMDRSKRNHQYIIWHAKTLVRQEKFRKALDHATQAIELSGGKPDYFLVRAEANAGEGNFEEAASDMEFYLTFYPKNIFAIEKYSIIAAEAGKNLTALSQLAKLINAKPNNPNYYVQRAKIYMKSENWEMAEMDFAMSLDFNPNNADVYIQKGLCRFYQGNSAGACNDWKNALRLGSFEAQELLYRNCKGVK